MLTYLLPFRQRVDPQKVTEMPGQHELAHALLFEHTAPLRRDRQTTLRIQRQREAPFEHWLTNPVDEWAAAMPARSGPGCAATSTVVAGLREVRLR